MTATTIIPPVVPPGTFPTPGNMQVPTQPVPAQPMAAPPLVAIAPNSMMSMVRIRNLSTLPWTKEYHVDQITIPAQSEMIVPFEMMVYWLGNPSLVDASIRQKDRTREIRRIRALYGCYDDDAMWEQKRPPLEVYALDGTRIYTVAEDPEGAHVTQATTSVSLALTYEQTIAHLTSQVAALTELMQQQMQPIVPTAPVAAPAPAAMPQPPAPTAPPTPQPAVVVQVPPPAPFPQPVPAPTPPIPGGVVDLSAYAGMTVAEAQAAFEAQRAAELQAGQAQFVTTAPAPPITLPPFNVDADTPGGGATVDSPGGATRVRV